MIARGALDLFPAEAFVSLQLLLAMRAGKLELAHGRTIQTHRRNARTQTQPEQRLAFTIALPQMAKQVLIILNPSA
jgi:hypothetical protein